MARRNIIVIGASAGGVEALTHIASALPPTLPASIFIVQHIAPHANSVLPELVARAGPLPAKHPEDGERIQERCIYVAPPDLHMLVKRGVVILRRGPHENRTRPAIDPLFRSAAVAYASRVVGVVLTGLLDDGTAGLIAVKRCGGTSVVQNPADALWPAMPRNALERDHVDHCVLLSELPALLVRLAHQQAEPSPPIPPPLALEARMAEREFPPMTTTEQSPLGHPSRLSCPQCGGVLNDVNEEGAARFRCQIGHGFTPEGLLAAQDDELERALAIAVRTHRDRLHLFRQMAASAQARGLSRSEAHWVRAAGEAERLAESIEKAIATLRRSEKILSAGENEPVAAGVVGPTELS
ncbi:MAG: chemotaxis protein CheB [Acetobacteraceae bacterium]|nr:chemotaxis protein CheB [Acetobacteraceae bacterium]